MTNQEINIFSRKITNASKSQLIVIMYEVAIKYIDDGIEALKNSEVDIYRLNLKRAKSVINELNSVLDMTQNISLELRRLYVFMIGVLVKADIRMETEELIRVRGMLEKLMSAFSDVSKSDESGPIMENTQTVYAGLTYGKNSLNESLAGQNIDRGFRA